jgi:hypothetical protein
MALTAWKMRQLKLLISLLHLKFTALKDEGESALTLGLGPFVQWFD